MKQEEPEVTDFQDRFYFSLSQLSNAFGPARETIAKRLQIAGVAANKRRSGHPVYHIGEAAAAILAGDRPSFDGIEDPDKLPAKERLDWYRSENEKTKLLRDRGELVLRDVHERVAAGLAKILLQVMETLPDLLERQYQFAPEVLESIEGVIDEAREDLARKLESYELL